MSSARPASRSGTRSHRDGGEAARPSAPPAAALDGVGEPPQREEREVALGDDVGLVPRPPELDERGMLPRVDVPSTRACSERTRGSRHAVLQPGPLPAAALGGVGQPARRAGSRARRRRGLAARLQSWTSEGCSHVEGSTFSTRACSESSSRHAVLQPGPRRAPQRLRAVGHSHVERTDTSSERQDLLSREPQLRRHRRGHASSVACSAAAGSSVAAQLARRSRASADREPGSAV